MRNADGVITVSGPDGVFETDTFWCGHCGAHPKIQPKCSPEDLGGRCTLCGNLICPQCVGKGCDPLEEKLRRAEAQYEARRSYGLL